MTPDLSMFCATASYRPGPPSDQTPLDPADAIRLVPPELLGHPRAVELVAGLLKVLNDNPQTLRWIQRISASLKPATLGRFVDSFVRSTILESWPIRMRFYETHGVPAPFTIVVNPTMRCNLRCTGCYSYKFGRADMDYDLLARVLREAHAFGTRFITLSGGEPLLYPHLFRLASEFRDMAFLMYTNGSLLDAERADRIAEAGNIFPALSVEGYETETDRRRGRGIFAAVLSAMEGLRNRGVFFGFSTTPTRVNSDIIADDSFIDFFIEKGALFGWFFTYIPVGKDPDLDLMATPAQRDRLRGKTREWMRTRPIFTGDFWNDGACVGGCLSASRYCYVTVDGEVQPCTFVQFATHNVKDHSLLEIWKSPFFSKIRSMQPYAENLLRPCKIIDNPECLRRAVEETGARPSCDGAGDIVQGETVRDFLDKYAKEWASLADAAWRSDEYKEGREVLIPLLGVRDVYRYFLHLRDAMRLRQRVRAE